MEFLIIYIVVFICFSCISWSIRFLKGLFLRGGGSLFSNPFEDMFDSISDSIHKLKSKKTKPQKELIQIHVPESSYDFMKDFVSQHRLSKDRVEVIKDKPYKINLSKDKSCK